MYLNMYSDSSAKYYQNDQERLKKKKKKKKKNHERYQILPQEVKTATMWL